MGELGQTEVLIPTEELELALLKTAIPGVDGSVRVEFGLSEFAPAEVRTLITRKVIHKLDQTIEKSSMLHPSNERANRVKDAVRNIAHKLKVKTTVKAIIAHFHDGKLMHFELEDRP